MEFKEFNKIARYSRECVITEKIDGTNAQILLFHTHSSYNGEFLKYILHQYEPDNDLGDRLVLMAGSRTRWLTLKEDNAGFANWVYQNRNELLELGEGRHYGEWWGGKIQRGYNLKEKRFSLFNVSRWTSKFNDGNTIDLDTKCLEVPICHVVPVLARGEFTNELINTCINSLKDNGSFAAKGFNDPEGIVIFHTAANMMFKKTIKNDELPKSLIK